MLNVLKFKFSDLFSIYWLILTNYKTTKKLLSVIGSLVLGLPIYAQYCGGGPTSSGFSNIDAVVLNGATSNINFTGTCPGIIGIEDQTNQVADLVAGSTYTMDVTFGTCSGNYNGAGQAWIDYNANGVFEASESIFSGTGNPGNAPWNAPVPITFTVPKTALNGTVNMRVIQIEFGSLPINPCNTFTWGSAIDFSIDISGGACGPASGLTVVSADATSGTVQWGGSAPEYIYEIGPEGYAPGSAAQISNGVTAGFLNMFTGLPSNSIFDVYVRSICAPGDTSIYGTPATFNTYNQGLFMDFNTQCAPNGFTDISNSGTATNLTDDATVNVTLPFSILYQGVLYSDVTIAENGGVLFGPNQTLFFSNTLLPDK